MNLRREFAIFPIFTLLFLPLRSATPRKAPSFSLEDLNGNTLVLDSLIAEGPVIIDFWATWCKSCDKALDMLQKLYSAYRDSGLSVLAITVDSPDKISRIKPMVSSRKWEFPILLDPDKKVKTLYGVMVLPTLFVINSEREVIYRHVGYNPREKSKLEEVIAPLLKEVPDSTGKEENGVESP